MKEVRRRSAEEIEVPLRAKDGFLLAKEVAPRVLPDRRSS
jgi:hypothetical protein